MNQISAKKTEKSIARVESAIRSIGRHHIDEMNLRSPDVVGAVHRASIEVRARNGRRGESYGEEHEDRAPH